MSSIFMSSQVPLKVVKLGRNFEADRGVFITTGNAVGWRDFSAGKLGQGVLLDSNILSAVLERDNLDPWVSKVLKTARVGVCQMSILEHLCSPIVIQQQMQYKDVVAKLKAKGITLLSGPCLSGRSTQLSSKVLKAEFELRSAKRTAGLKRKGEEPGSAETAADPAKKGFPWEKMLGRSRVDVALACEGHLKGLAFLTADQNVEGDFGDGLDDQGLKVYTISREWLESGMTTPPPEMDPRDRKKKD
ncbi:hypothetical protein Dda_2508 [Drechslerella dactyloides]|uniref:PIN domain-containing protein n=1 Tax=Drechslerella dactyloides TaxID=74499 RepID=A0AAD6IZQ5_DREDA|nr:hypothetical protein Dda_2508 [Drechslerella dactyloides]